MLNLILHITLPTGIRLTNGQILQQPVTFDVLSACDPFYASVDQVRLSAGPTIRPLQDVTVACQIYNASQEASMLCANPPKSGPDAVRYQGALNQWVQNRAARALLLNVSQAIGGPASHVLANFSVTKSKGFESEGVPAALADLKSSLAQYDITLRSCGKVAPGGHAKPLMAGKGVFDFGEATPARTWIVTGMGANETSPTHIGGSGGRGKSVKFFGSPMFAGMMTGYRMGVWQAGVPLYAAPALSFYSAGYL